MSAKKPIVQAFYDEPTYTLTFVVFDPDTKDAVVIDPVLDFDPLAWGTSTGSVDKVEAYLKDNGLKVQHVLETHAHADHLTGAQILKRRLGAKVVIGKQITAVQETFKPVFDLPDSFATDGSQFDVLLADNDKLESGSLTIEAIATPGHTPACLTYKIGDAVFTGDALFMEDYGTGRCDFPKGDANALYRSIKERLYTLPDDTRVFVGHDYQPNGRALRYETTIGRSKKHNVQLNENTTHDDFVSFRQKRDAGLRPPQLIFQSVQVNVNAGKLYEPRGSGLRYLNVPMNLFGETDELGEPKKK